MCLDGVADASNVMREACFQWTRPDSDEPEFFGTVELHGDDPRESRLCHTSDCPFVTVDNPDAFIRNTAEPQTLKAVVAKRCQAFARTFLDDGNIWPLFKQKMHLLC